MSKWKIEYNLPEISNEFSGSNLLLAAVLSLRGFTTAESADAFLKPTTECIGNPFILKGMKAAVERINLAIANHEKVVVFGDYDVDGITATCLLVDYLRKNNLEVKPEIPVRKDGYGLRSKSLDDFKHDGYSLVITVDCGITAYEESKHAQEIGLDLIVTDHHECKQDELPDCCIVIDPKQPGDEYSFKELAGVGVAFKLVCGIEGEDISCVLDEYCDLLTLGTIADVMPIIGENRFYVIKGLSKINNSPRKGIISLLCLGNSDKAIEEKIISNILGKCSDKILKSPHDLNTIFCNEFEKSKNNASKAQSNTNKIVNMLKGGIDTSSIGFFLAPRINAAGRMDSALEAYDLLMSNDIISAFNHAIFLHNKNVERHVEEEKIWNHAREQLKTSNYVENSNKPIVLSSTDWHPGVIGIVASRLSEKYHVPTIIIHINSEQEGKGSCRSFGNFNIFDALSQCSEYLETYGGHAAAAGLNILEENIDSFREKLSECYKDYLNSAACDTYDTICDLLIDDPSVLTTENVSELWDKLAPFGNGNQEPVFCMTNVVLDSFQTVGNDNKHLKLNVFAGGSRFDCIYFSHGADSRTLRKDDRIDIAFIPKVNSFRGRNSVQLVIKNIRKHDSDVLCGMIREGNYCCRTAISNYRPDRSDFIRVWKNIQMGCPEKMDAEKYTICLKVFEQAGLIDSVDSSKPVDGAVWTDLNETAFMKTFGWNIVNDKR